MPHPREERIAHFREAFRAEPEGAYREWFLLQEELRDDAEDETARALADDLWRLVPDLPFASAGERARFHHNLGAFFGSAGPAADLARARACFAAALLEWSAPDSGAERSRALHNFAGALCNLGASAEEIREAVELYESALAWRTPERAAGRGVTLHNLGRALRRLAELAPEESRETLARSASVLREAVQVRAGRGLAEGHAASLFDLGVTLTRLSEFDGGASASEARQALADAADRFDALGMPERAGLARERRWEEESPPSLLPLPRGEGPG